MRKKRLIRQICLIMLLTICFSGSGFAQVTLSVKNRTIKQILPQLEKASGYSVFYSNEMAGLNNQIADFTITNTSISEALNTLFGGTQIDYEIKADKQILLFPKQATATGEKRTITGQIVDENNNPLIGVTVMIKGTTTGTVTDTRGNYRLEITDPAVLVLSYMGYATTEVAVGGGKSVLDITLSEDTQDIEEIVVIGYGAVRKKDLTGSVAAVSGSELAVKKTTTLSSSLQGAVSGLMVRRNSSEPGASASSMHIRGVTTISDSSPLVIVDGVPGTLDHVNPNDVESISVLKDAASASIYGSRAAAGVILVTTKRANQSDLSLTYSGEYGFDIPTYQPQMVGVTRYLEMSNELAYNDNPGAGFFQTYSSDQVRNWLKYNMTDPNNYPLTDWTDLILKDSAPRQTHSIKISGGNKSVRTTASMSYDKVDGLYGDRRFERFMTRINNDFTISKMLSASVDIYVRRAKNHTPNYSPFGSMRMTPAIYAAMWDDGRIAEGKSGGNPYGLLEMGGYTDSWSTQVGGKASLDFKPFAGFTISGIVAPYINNTQQKKFRTQAFYTLATDPDVFGGWLEDGGNAYSTNKLDETRKNDHTITTQAIASYVKSFGDHNLNVMAGFESHLYKYEEMGAYRDQYLLTQYPYLNVGPEEIMGNSGTANEYAYNSFFGRLMYNYKSKYLIQANVRRDGSSRFHKDYRWGTFPSVSGGWVISEENFFKNADALNWLSFMKFRASWGMLGNERIGNYLYSANIRLTGNSYFYEDGVVTSYGTASQRKYAVRDISWETTTSTDIGADFTFLNNRLRFSFDYYWKKTKDMLLETEIPTFLGLDNPQMNAGKMSTKGFDIDLGWSEKRGDFSYSISANFSDFLSKVDYMQNTQSISDGKIKIAGSYFNSWYGYISEGIYQTQEQIDNSATLNNQVKVGDMWYRDISGPDGVPDGIISAEYDRVPLGNSLPRFLFGGQVNFAWKNIDFSMTFQGVGKQKVRLERAMVEPLRSSYGNIPALYDGKYWSPFNTDEENANAKYPRLTRANIEANMALSDYWLFNGWYFRMKNITLGYTLPEQWTKKALMQKVRVYATSSDLFCISKFPKGWDPEMGTSSYPITTSLIFGLSVTF